MESIKRLELKNMTRVFSGTTALQDFNLEIDGGMFVTLLGPSGCGKSTALNCIAGLLDLTSGEIILNGTPIHHVPAEKRGFGMVFQNYALFPHLTAIQNVSYGLEMRPMPKSERNRRIQAALDLVHLSADEFGHRFPAQLSGGQQQRLAIARTIALEPNLLLLDEPLSNLDTKLRTEMRIEIKRLHRQLGLTTIYVTHDQSEAMSLSDLVVVMRKGKIEQVGSPQEIYDRPNNLYVADFMGYVNRIPATVRGCERKTWDIETDTGEHLRACSTDADASNWQPGQRVLACSRPEDMTTLASGDVNRLQGTVHLFEYAGQVFELLVNLPGDIQLLIHSPELVEIERRVEFSIRPERLLLFATHESTAVPQPVQLGGPLLSVRSSTA